MPDMNVFRILADVSHSASKCILIWAIHSNRSAEGVSLLTQWMYMFVFCARYLDLFWVAPWYSWWNAILKVLYISSSAYIVWVMMRVFARTREKEYAWKLASFSMGGSVISAPLVCLIFRGVSETSIYEIMWTFSIILESVCILPQLLLLRQTTVPTVIDSYYLVTLGSYRMFYIFNWILRAASEGHFDPISVIFGVIQTALYVDFAWVYYSRQRVKLRGGGVVDQDDLSKSFLVRRIIGRGSRADREDEEAAEEDGVLGAGQENGVIRPSAPRAGLSWGARGISVSADDTLPDRQAGQQGAYADATTEGDAQMIDPAHFEDDEDADAPPPPAKDDKFRGSDAANGHLGAEQNAWASNTAGRS